MLQRFCFTVVVYYSVFNYSFCFLQLVTTPTYHSQTNMLYDVATANLIRMRLVVKDFSSTLTNFVDIILCLQRIHEGYTHNNPVN